MGSPVSVVVKEIVMQNIEECALTTCRQTIPLWLRYVDDTFTAVHKDEIDEFHDHLNEQNADIQFTKEVEDGKFPFLDCLVSSLRADVSYFLCFTWKRDVCITPFLIVFQYPAVWVLNFT